MKQRKITWSSGFIVACMLVSSSFLFSSYQAKKMTDDVWKMLGLSRSTGTDAVKNSFLNGYLYHYGARNFKNCRNDRGESQRHAELHEGMFGGADFKNNTKS
jgi:hypothetical protein